MNPQRRIRTNFLITTAVIITVALALFMSQQDERDGESLIANWVGTVETGIQGTPVSIFLPTTTAMAVDVMATATVTATTGKTAVFLTPYCTNAPAHWLPHTVREGESVYHLSITSGATVAEIVHANCLKMRQRITGLILYLPPRPPERIVCGPPNWWQPQLVYAGDTLYGLSVRHGTTIYAIMHANCLSNSYLMAGRTLYLPPLVVPPTARPTTTAMATATIVPSSTPSMTVTAVPTTIPTLTPTMTATIAPTQPPITPTVTLPPSPTIPITPLPTETAVLTPSSTPTAPTPPTVTPLPSPTATTVPPTATAIP